MKEVGHRLYEESAVRRQTKHKRYALPVLLVGEKEEELTHINFPACYTNVDRRALFLNSLSLSTSIRGGGGGGERAVTDIITLSSFMRVPQLQLNGLHFVSFYVPLFLSSSSPYGAISAFSWKKLRRRKNLAYLV